MSTGGNLGFERINNDGHNNRLYNRVFGTAADGTAMDFDSLASFNQSGLWRQPMYRLPSIPEPHPTTFRYHELEGITLLLLG